MKYVVLIYQGSTPLPGSDAWEAMSADEQQRVYTDYQQVTSRPEVTPGVPMGSPEDATTVRVQDGKPLMTDGPFVETKEAVGGYFIIEADDLDAAVEIVAQVPAARLGGAVEIRPMATYW